MDGKTEVPMEGFLDFLLSNETLAIVIPLIVFLITLFMVVKRLISFVFTLVLLAFAIVSGLAIINYDVVRDYLNNDIPQERYEELKDGLYRFRHQIIDAFDELKQDLRQLEEEGEPAPDKADERTNQLLEEVERQEARLNDLIDQLESRQTPE